MGILGEEYHRPIPIVPFADHVKENHRGKPRLGKRNDEEKENGKFARPVEPTGFDDAFGYLRKEIAKYDHVKGINPEGQHEHPKIIGAENVLADEIEGNQAAAENIVKMTNVKRIFMPGTCLRVKIYAPRLVRIMLYSVPPTVSPTEMRKSLPT